MARIETITATKTAFARRYGNFIGGQWPTRGPVAVSRTSRRPTETVTG